MSVQYTVECAVQRGMFSTPGRYHEYSGDIMSTLRGVQYTGGYHEYTGGYHDKCGGKVIGKTIEFVWKPQCTEHSPVYS